MEFDLSQVRVPPEERIDLKLTPTRIDPLYADENEYKALLKANVKRMSELQERFYAASRHALLIVFQAMDTAGKDGCIEHVLSGLNPQGCIVHSFRHPSATEIEHDFLWRTTQALPEQGMIGVFNRSYYEEVLVVRVHPEILEKQKIPPALVGKDVFEDRYRDIRAFERYLSGNGILVRKFFLHVSRKEQKRRFLERLEDPAKNWKFSGNDLGERGYWKDYMKAYEEMIRNTATPDSPWYVVPADNKWYTRVVVAGAVVDALASLDLEYPKVGKSQLAELGKAREALRAEK